MLDRLGLSADARVGTFAWNTARHLELYFAVPCSGRVLHTLNIRLFPEQLTYIVNHAADEAIFVDRSLLGLLAPLLPTLRTVRHLVVMDDGGDADVQLGGDGLERARLRGAAGRRRRRSAWPDLDENRAASMCYTSGTTGNPKGALYSHRSTFLHTFGVLQADSAGVVRARRRCCRSSPCSTPTPGASPTPRSPRARPWSCPAPTCRLRRWPISSWSEKVTVAAGVPTIWMGVLPLLEGRDTSHIRKIPCGGSAVPKALSEGYRRVTGKPIVQAWGMTETSPIASVFQLKSTLEGLSEDEQADLRATVGMINFGVECRIVATTDGSESGDGRSGRAAPSSSPGTGRRRVSCRCAAPG